MVKYKSSYEVPPLRRIDLRRYARSVRRDLGLLNTHYFPIVELLEALHQMGIEQDIIDDLTWDKQYGKEKHAVYSLTDRIINIKESVYNGAVNDCGRDRFTIAHEIAHVLLLDNHEIKVAKIRDGNDLPPYRDPEWQADCLAGELLMPYHLCKDMSISEIVKMCKVSLSAAHFQKSKY